MEAEDPARPPPKAGLHKPGGAIAGLLGVLEKEPYLPAEVGPVLGQKPGASQKAGNVSVMAAGMHSAKLLRAVAQLGVDLLDGQSVGIGPKRHDPVPFLLSPEHSIHPGAIHPLMLGDPQSVQLSLNALGSPGLLPAHLRVAVELPA